MREGEIYDDENHATDSLKLLSRPLDVALVDANGVLIFAQAFFYTDSLIVFASPNICPTQI